jgi:hypothetical protein
MQACLGVRDLRSPCFAPMRQLARPAPVMATVEYRVTPERHDSNAFRQFAQGPGVRRQRRTWWRLRLETTGDVATFLCSQDAAYNTGQCRPHRRSRRPGRASGVGPAKSTICFWVAWSRTFEHAQFSPARATRAAGKARFGRAGSPQAAACSMTATPAPSPSPHHRVGPERHLRLAATIA